MQPACGTSSGSQLRTGFQLEHLVECARFPRTERLLMGAGSPVSDRQCSLARTLVGGAWRGASLYGSVGYARTLPLDASPEVSVAVELFR